MKLRALFEETAVEDILRDMTGFAVLRLMELGVGALTDAAAGERPPDHVVPRNGHRDWETRAGTPLLRIPKLRKGSYFRALVEPLRMGLKALTAVSQEA